jgi:hypothetical protein
LDRNGWPKSIGISGRIESEMVADLERNTHCQLGQAHSLREICGGLAMCLGKLKHPRHRCGAKVLHLSLCQRTSAVATVPEGLLSALGQVPDSCARREAPFRFKNKLFSLDATLIELCVTLFDWAKYRQKKGAIKLHLLLDHDGYF